MRLALVRPASSRSLLCSAVGGSREYGGGFSVGGVRAEATSDWGRGGGGGRDRAIPAAWEMSSRPSTRFFNFLTFSSNFLASHMAHLVMARNDFCFWLSRMRCRKDAAGLLKSDKVLRDLHARMALSSWGGSGMRRGRSSYFRRRTSISVRRYAILLTH